MESRLVADIAQPAQGIAALAGRALDGLTGKIANVDVWHLLGLHPFSRVRSLRSHYAPFRSNGKRNARLE